MSKDTFPMLNANGVSIGRLALGGNPISGFSHQNEALSKEMVDYFSVVNIKKLFRECEAEGINTLFGRADHFVLRLLNECWNEGGAIQWMAQTAPEQADQMRNIDNAWRGGAKGIYIHGGIVRKCWEAGDHDELRRQLDRIREHGVLAGIASHDPQVVLDMEAGGWNLDFYMVCLYNLGGYKGRVGTEPKEPFDDADRLPALRAIRSVERPCFAYKVLGAGRKAPEPAMAEVFEYLKPSDGVVVGMFPKHRPDMVAENAALVRRLTRITKRP